MSKRRRKKKQPEQPPVLSNPLQLRYASAMAIALTGQCDCPMCKYMKETAIMGAKRFFPDYFQEEEPEG